MVNKDLRNQLLLVQYINYNKKRNIISNYESSCERKYIKGLIGGKYASKHKKFPA